MFLFCGSGGHLRAVRDRWIELLDRLVERAVMSGTIRYRELVGNWTSTKFASCEKGKQIFQVHNGAGLQD